MAYLLFAVVLSATIIGFLSVRQRESNDPRKSVEAFDRAIKALTPERNGKGNQN